MVSFIPFLMIYCIITLIFLIFFLHNHKKPYIFAAESLIINCINYSKSPRQYRFLNTFCV